GIPEDDPRNAATIADNVGDNVGDCAGMAADLFESYEVTLVASLILGAAAYFVVSAVYMNDLRPAVAVLFGLILASVIQVLTQYFTDTKYRPVQEIAESTVTGPATTVLSGFSIGLESTVWSVLIIAGAVMGSFYLGDTLAERLYFIALTGMGMLTTVGVVVSMDT